MPLAQLNEFLDDQNVKYLTVSHSPAFTAQEIAAAAHIPGKELAKTVIVKIGGEMAMAVLPATYKVDLERLRSVTGGETVELADEQEFETRFPACQPGAMPPFGNLYGMAVWVDQALTEDEQIAFNAGSHIELVKLSYLDFERLVQPKVASFAITG